MTVANGKDVPQKLDHKNQRYEDLEDQRRRLRKYVVQSKLGNIRVFQALETIQIFYREIDEIIFTKEKKGKGGKKN